MVATIIEHMFPSSSLPVDVASCVDELEEVERLKGALCARQARVTAHLAALSPSASDRSLAREVGLARHESPTRGGRLLRLGRALVDDHPEVLALLEAGEINEARAELVCTETSDLCATDRRTADREIAARLAAEPGLGDRDVTDLARRVSFRIDADAAERRRERARAERHVSTRTYGDGTAQVAGRVADHQMVAIMTSLDHQAQVLRAAGCDDRTRAQIVADLFVERLTGQVTATATPVRIDLVVSAETLLGGDEPAEVAGLGPVPAQVARDLVLASPEQATVVRRLFADTDHLVAMESTATRFAGLLRQFVELRDRRCRTPWCTAPIRHGDHVTARRRGGSTSAHNAQGLCEACNLAKEEPDWRHEVVSTDVLETHTVEITTPTGHRHRSRAPSPPGAVARDHFAETRPGVFTLIA